MKRAIVITSLAIALAPAGASAGFFEEILTKPVEDAVEDEKRRTEDEVRDATRQEIDAVRTGVRNTVSGAVRGTRHRLGCMLRGDCPAEPDKGPAQPGPATSAAANPAWGDSGSSGSPQSSAAARLDCSSHRQGWNEPRPPPGCEQISPFGTLEWGDDILSVITKLAARGDIQSLRIGYSDYDAASLRSREAARAAVHEACSAWASGLPQEHIYRIPGARRQFCLPPVLFAKPVTLAGLEFEVGARFGVNHPAVIEDTDALATDEFYIPFELVGVRLATRSRDGRQITASCRAIAARVESRYGAVPGLQVQPGSSLTWPNLAIWDEVGTRVSVVRESCTIDYSTRSKDWPGYAPHAFHRWRVEQLRKHAPPPPAVPVSAADADL